MLHRHVIYAHALVSENRLHLMMDVIVIVIGFHFPLSRVCQTTAEQRVEIGI